MAAGDGCLYEMMGLEKTASQAEIKKAYYKLALQWHPDRNPGPEATARFQALQRIYAVLSDPDKRALYDRTGSLEDTEEAMQGGDFQDLFAAFREALKVTEDDVDRFAATYRGSAEERGDLLGLYRRFSGDMPCVFEWLMLSRPELDSHRFRDELEAAIGAGELRATKAYRRWSAQVAATPRPVADPLAPPKKTHKKQGGSDGDSQALVAAIRDRGRQFDGLLASLEAKYANKPAKKGKQGGAKQRRQQQQQQPEGGEEPARQKKRGGRERVAADSSGDDGTLAEPTEEEFAAARERLEQRRAGGGSGGAASRRRGAAAAAKKKRPAADAGAGEGSAAGEGKRGGKKQQCARP